MATLHEMEKQKCSGVEEKVAKLDQKITSLSKAIQKLNQEVEEEDTTLLKVESQSWMPSHTRFFECIFSCLCQS